MTNPTPTTNTAQTTERRVWWAQNEATDSDGFFLEGDAFHEAERAELRAMGAPDTDSIRWIGQPEIVDRDEAIVEADVSAALAAWIDENLGPVEE